MSDELLSIVIKKSLGEEIILQPMVEELLEVYMNDPNSSFLRESITTKIAGCTPIPGKLGRDAYDPLTKREKEVKPKNFTGKSTNGSGCFNDYTRARFNKDNEYNLEIIHSLFIQGRVAYVVEFTFDAIASTLDKQIREKCEVKNNSYVRTASWNYKHWINHESLKLHYINIDLLKESKGVNKKLLKELEQLSIL